MKAFTRSFVTATLIAASVLAFTYGVCGSRYSRMVVGPPAYSEIRQIVHGEAARVIRLRNEDGSVVVHTHPQERVILTADVRIYARARGTADVARDYGRSLVAHSGDDTVFEVVTEPMERPDEVDVLVDYEVFVPVGANIDVQNASGNVTIGAGCGAVTVAGRNTDIAVSEPRGKVMAESTNGRIRIEDAADDASVKTVNGSVYAYMASGNLTARTTNGEIVAHVLQPSVNRCDLATRNGGITLVLAKDCSAKLDARTTHGVVSSDFAIAADNGVNRRRHVRGTIGEGRTGLQMSTLNGNIWIARSGL